MRRNSFPISRCPRSLKWSRNFFGAVLWSALAVVAQAENLVDPTRPSGTASAAQAQQSSTPSLRLTLVRLGAQPLAIINGATVRVGTVVAGKRVVAIQPGRVVLTGGDGEQTLLLVPVPQSSAKSASFSSIKRRPSL